ncbi:MAG: ABC transporter ATP-binding protein [Clostridia bacterium]|nr:ABC transporter ATP-binding protein [Clostridia bacterium]
MTSNAVIDTSGDNPPIEHQEGNMLEVNNLRQYFPIKAGFFKRTVGYVKAVDGVTFNIKKGTTMGLVGESGCGKTTTGRTILRLYKKTSGQVLVDGEDVYKIKNIRKYRPNMQIVFQDPYSSLSPRMPVAEIIGEAVKEHKIVPKAEFEDYITKVMNDCGLPEYYKQRYPHEFSGGQRQRICIARALALKPKLVICDEPVSALDVSIQAQVINLFKDLQEKYGFTYLFISHDLSVVEHISDQVGVMYLGNLVEYAQTDELFKHPAHPYTEALFSAIPIPDPNVKMNRIILEGTIPSPANPPRGCKFHTRCSKCMGICKKCVPPQLEISEGHFVSCFLYIDEDKKKEMEEEFDINEAKRLEEERIKEQKNFILKLKKKLKRKKNNSNGNIEDSETTEEIEDTIKDSEDSVETYISDLEKK